MPTIDMITKHTLESFKFLRDRGYATDDEVNELEHKYKSAKESVEYWLSSNLELIKGYQVTKLLTYDKEGKYFCPFVDNKHTVTIYNDNHFYCNSCEKGMGPIALFQARTGCTKVEAIKALSA